MKKIDDPAAYAAETYGGEWKIAETVSPWAPWACHFTTTRDFGQVAGFAYHNNCGPTAVTNLLCMAGQRYGGAAAADREAARQVYHRAARFGVRRLYFINARNRLFHGSSDLRAGGWVRRMCQRELGLRPRLRLRRMTEKNLRAALDRGAILYLMLLGHPAYGSHHLLGYGYVTVEDGPRRRTLLQVADGHAGFPRYLDPAGARGMFWEVRFRQG